MSKQNMLYKNNLITRIINGIELIELCRHAIATTTNKMFKFLDNNIACASTKIGYLSLIRFVISESKLLMRTAVIKTRVTHFSRSRSFVDKIKRLELDVIKRDLCNWPQ